MTQKEKPAAMVAAGPVVRRAAWQAAHDEHGTLPPARQRQLAVVPHSDGVAVIVRESADSSRIDVETWTKHDNGWRLNGFTPSFAAVLLDDVIAGLIQARDARGGH